MIEPPICRNTATKYLQADKLPSELKEPRTWRTREDPFKEDWPDIEAKLKEAPGLEAKTLFEDLLSRRPERYHDGQLRTLQRRVKQWRAEHGPGKELNSLRSIDQARRWRRTSRR